MSKSKSTRLRIWRILSGYTARECADLCGIPLSTWWSYENGGRQASMKARVHISRKLGTRVSVLFDAGEVAS